MYDFAAGDAFANGLSMYDPTGFASCPEPFAADARSAIRDARDRLRRGELDTCRARARYACTLLQEALLMGAPP